MKVGFIDYYLDEWHANNYPAWIKEASNGEMEVTLAYGLIEKNGQMTLAEFRDALGTSRKYAVALLEYFDNRKLTKKVGDARIKA